MEPFRKSYDPPIAVAMGLSELIAHYKGTIPWQRRTLPFLQIHTPRSTNPSHSPRAHLLKHLLRSLPCVHLHALLYGLAHPAGTALLLVSHSQHSIQSHYSRSPAFTHTLCSTPSASRRDSAPYSSATPNALTTLITPAPPRSPTRSAPHLAHPAGTAPPCSSATPNALTTLITPLT